MENFILKINPAHLLAINQFSSTDETRYVLGGVLVHIKEGKCRLVATDGRRLMVHEPLEEKSEPAIRDAMIIIPSPIIEMLASVSPRVPMNLMVEDGKFSFGGFNFNLFFEPVEGNYPNYEMVIPNPMPKAFPAEPIVTIDLQLLTEALAVLDVLEGSRRHGVQPVWSGKIDAPIIFQTKKTLIVLMLMKLLDPPHPINQPASNTPSPNFK